MERFKLIASVYLLWFKEDKILLLRRKNTGYQDGNYGLPSGHLDEGESMTHGIAREVSEEIGVTIKPKDLRLVSIMHRKEKDERLDFFFVGKNIQGDPKNMEPHLCDDLSWFPVDDLAENTIQYIERAIENYKNGVLYDELGWGD